MTDSIIPYSFVAGTKAKASEVNANFTSLADIIAQNQTTVTSNVQDLQGQINTLSSDKVDKSKYIDENSNVDLNDYKTEGTYIFSSNSTIANIPKGASGTLVVKGVEDELIRQIWFCDGENPEVLTRIHNGTSLGNWYSTFGQHTATNPGNIKLSNGLLFQYGTKTSCVLTYPIAYTDWVCVVITKHGYNSSYARSDTGIVSSSLTGFTFTTAGDYQGTNWMALGK